MGELAAWLNNLGFKTREGNRFTAHAIKDIFNNRFYLGLVIYRGIEYPGQHEALISRYVFDQVQGRRGGIRAPRKVWQETGVLQGFISCGLCGNPLQSDRSRFGKPMYRERHGHQCESNGHSAMADVFDNELGVILRSLELEPAWCDRIAHLAVSDYQGPSEAELRNRLRKLGVAYVETGMSDARYRHRKAELEDQIKAASAVVPPSYEEAAALLLDLEALWKEATPEERRKLISPLIERVYVDMELKLVGAITPTPAFRALLRCAVQRAAPTSSWSLKRTCKGRWFLGGDGGESNSAVELPQTSADDLHRVP